MDHNKINKKIEEALASFDGAERATPKPFLMTRINARLQQETAGSLWTKALAFISRPLVAGLSILLLLIMNLVIIFSQKENTSGNNMAIQNANAAKYDFAINVSSFYDLENQ